MPLKIHGRSSFMTEINSMYDTLFLLWYKNRGL